MIEELVDSLLYEGYALYPYTPGAGKNATPTPFGIVYPAGYAHGFDHLQRAVPRAWRRAPSVDVEVRFLQASGERHQAVERRVGRRRDRPRRRCAGEVDASPSSRWSPACTRRRSASRTTTAVRRGPTRGEALEHSLISTHPLLRVRGGRFVSPLEAPGCTNVNTWPVLARRRRQRAARRRDRAARPPAARAARAAAACSTTPRSRRRCCCTCTRSRTPSARRSQSGDPDGARDGRARAQLDAGGDHAPARRHAPDRHRADARPVPPRPREQPATEREALVDGVMVRLGDRIVLRLADRTDTYDRMLDGRTATIERIYLDYDDRTHLGVTDRRRPGPGADARDRAASTSSSRASSSWSRPSRSRGLR